MVPNNLNNHFENLQCGIKNDDKYINEIWKIIKHDDLKDVYEISNMGRYRNRISGEILVPYKCNNYLMASLYSKEKRKNRFVCNGSS